MYSNKCVVCILVNGKPLKENYDGTIEIPSYTEYVLRFKNKHPEDVLVKFTIDGENVAGNGYILRANSTSDIERFADSPRKFKFVDIDSDESIMDGKNHNAAPGLIQAQFFFRKKYNYPIAPQPTWIINNISPINGPYRQSYTCGSVLRKKSRSSDDSAILYSASLNDNTIDNVAHSFSMNATNNVGVTVEGNYSTQTFSTSHFDIGELAAEIKIILKPLFYTAMSMPAPVQDPLLYQVAQENSELIQELENLKKLKELKTKQSKIQEEINLLKSQLNDC